jgi:hypothetical protein
MLHELGSVGGKTHFENLESIAGTLRDMADQQQKGVPFSEAKMAFINEAVTSKVQGCTANTPPTYKGWNARLLFAPSGTMEPTIADVHTSPGGADLGDPKVLCVATGLPRLMVVTIDTCQGPRAYACLAFAYHEVTTKPRQAVGRPSDVSARRAMDDPDPAVIRAKRWSEKIDAADAFIFVTPEYNHGAPRREQPPPSRACLPR